MNKGLKFSVVTLAVLILLISVSCATTKVEKKDQDQTRLYVIEGNLSTAKQSLIKQKERYVDPLLYQIDYGIISLYLGDYDEAIEHFSKAETNIEANKAKSVSEGASALLVNDNVRAYTGASYEDVYVNLFKAISFAKKGDYESALVEMKRADIKMTDKALNEKTQESGLVKLMAAITAKPFDAFPNQEIKPVMDSAFVDYMSMLIYRANGEEDNAQVDLNRLKAKLGESHPVVDSADVSVPKGKARVNFVSFEGLIAPKVEEAVTVKFKDEVFHKVAWPKISSSSGSAVGEVVVTCSNGDRVTLKTIENLSDMARSDLALTAKSSYLRSYYRGYMKMTAAWEVANVAYQTAMELAKEVHKQARSVASSLPSIAQKVAYNSADKALVSSQLAALNTLLAALNAINETEKADTRMGVYLPDRVSVGALTLDPGVYDFIVTYRIGNGSVTQKYTGVEVKEDFNLLFSTCAK